MATLYTTAMLRLAMRVADHPPLVAPDVRKEARTPVCGSHITVDLAFDDAGRVAAVGLAVHACAVGQAAAAILASGAPGRTPAALAAAAADIAAWLADAGAPLPDWPGLTELAVVRAHPARHAALLLPFNTAAAASGAAASGRRDAAA